MTDDYLFDLGDRVEKIAGYKFVGVVVARFRNMEGHMRYCVEHHDGMIHIFRPAQLRRHTALDMA